MWQLIALLLCAAPAADVHAQWLLTRTPFNDSEPGSVGIGVGFRWGQSPYVGVGSIGSIYGEYDHDLVPLYLYEGKYLFAHGTEAGVHLVRNSWFSADLVGRYRFDRLQTDADEFFAGMDNRDQTVDAGLALTVEQPWGIVSLSVVTDTLGRHDGSEADLSYRLPLTSGRWSFTPSLSLVYLNGTLANYYYGVRRTEATPERPFYEPGAAYNWRAGLNLSYHLWENWHLFGNLSFESLDDAIKDSPLTERSDLLGVYLGGSYSLGNARDIKVRREGTKLWSFRLNAGYTVEDTFSQVLLGNFKQHEDIDTYMVGATLGRLLKDGRRGDVWGRFSINRRLENDFQEDFNEYVGYVMVMGSGYAPWTDREVFRFGFGLGLSYAERVPAVEQYKQGRSGEQTSHWLNYMEAQLDFPFSNFGGSRDCYFGLSLIHRSGVFARSDLFRSTRGGSEQLTGHVECKF